MLYVRSVAPYTCCIYIYICIYAFASDLLLAQLSAQHRSGALLVANRAMARSYSRAKETLAYETLLDIAKVQIPKDPEEKFYLHDDMVVVVETYKSFFLAVANHTQRLNPSSCANMGKDLFRMTAPQSKFFGEAMSKAYAYCMQAGAKAPSGAKLAMAVKAVYNANASGAAGSTKRECKTEPVKAEPPLKACKTEALSPPAGRRALVKCLSSPSQILSLYSGGAAAIKQEKTEVTYVYIHTWIYI